MPPRKQIALARFEQPLGRIGARRLEQSIPHVIAGGLRENERLVDERCEEVEHIQFLDTFAARDRRRTL
jgi:hypothetical protein